MFIEQLRISTDERDRDQPLVAAFDGVVEGQTVATVRLANGRDVRRRVEHLQEPEFHVRGVINCWLCVNADGVVTGIDINRDSFNAVYENGASFACVLDEAEIQVDLNVQTIDSLQDVIDRGNWKIDRVEDDEGAVYFDESVDVS